MILTLEILFVLSTGILFYHSQRSYGLTLTINIWFAGLAFGIIKELTMTRFGGLYTYAQFNLMAFDIPVIYAVFWTNLSYIAWQWSNNLLGRDYIRVKSFDQHQPIVFLVLVFMSFAIETLYAQFGLITWVLDSPRPLWENTPLLAPFAYGFSGVLFLKGIKVFLFGEGRSEPVLKINPLLIQPILVLVLMGLLFLWNTLIILSFS